MLLLALTAISLVTMPFTQHLWTWDRFLHGGQDFETTAFVILMALNLVLVLAKCCKQNVGKLLEAWQCFSILRTPRLTLQTLALSISDCVECRISLPDLPTRNLPLQI